MRFLPAGIIFLLLGWSSAMEGQKSTFDSFLTRLSEQYEVEIALAPELIPTLDSLQDFGPGINNVEELLQQILQGKNIAYQIVDGNKILLRRESQISHLPGFLELRG